MIDVRVPKAGLQDGEVEITEVFVSVGERVTAGQAVAEVEGDKITYEVSTDSTGVVVAIFVAAGDEVQIGDVIVRIDEEDS